MARMNKPTRSQVLETFAVFAAISLLTAIFSNEQTFTLLALALLALSLFIKPLAEGITRWWLKLAVIFACINNRVILTLLFYLFLTPIALIYRLFNKDPLNLERSDAGSFYSVRSHTYTKIDLEKMW